MSSILNWYVEEGTIFKGGSGRASTCPTSARRWRRWPVGAPPAGRSASCGAPTRRPGRSSAWPPTRPSPPPTAWCPSPPSARLAGHDPPRLEDGHRCPRQRRPAAGQGADRSGRRDHLHARAQVPGARPRGRGVAGGVRPPGRRLRHHRPRPHRPRQAPAPGGRRAVVGRRHLVPGRARRGLRRLAGLGPRRAPPPARSRAAAPWPSTSTAPRAPWSSGSGPSPRASSAGSRPPR